MKRYFINGLWSRGRTGLVSLGAALLILAGCGGGNGSDGAVAPEGGGQVVIGLTDAPGDFLSYGVDVLSLELTRANGAMVQTLPSRTRFDFAQYAELTEFLTVATVPLGAYTDARLRLDFSGADITVEDSLGNAVAATVKDSAGQPAGVLELAVKFDTRRPLVVLPGVPAHLTLDFNLEASNQVELATSPPTVTVAPVLLAEVVPERPKVHRVRGPLEEVNTARSGYRVGIRPFHLMKGHHGSLFVHTDAATFFEINGVRYQGAAGLAEFALLPPFTATVAIGNLAVPGHRFNAIEVHAGSSVPYGTSDVVTGSVKARSGDRLTLTGASLFRQDGTVTYRDTLLIDVSASTRIVREGSGGVTSTADLSAGSRITAFGNLDPGLQTLDATGADDLVRILHSTMTGTVLSASPVDLHVSLQTINGRGVGRYDFSGTGSSAATNSLPTDYEIDTTGLSLLNFAVGVPVQVRGFVRPFGQVPADFSARTVVDVSAVPAHLAVDWSPATAAPFVSADSAAVQFDLTASPLLHHVFRTGVATDLAGSIPEVKPEATGRGLFAIARSGSVQVFGEFPDYVSALQTELGAGRQADFTAAHGLFDDASVSLTARRAITVVR